jgi:hypothetical protein
MVSIVGAKGWSSGFVVSGFAGVALLLISGTFLGIKANGLKQVLENIASKNPDAAAPRLVPPRLVTVLPAINTGIALAVVFDMVTKPASVGIALAVIGIGIVSSAFLALRHRPPAGASRAAESVSAHAA